MTTVQKSWDCSPPKQSAGRHHSLGVPRWAGFFLASALAGCSFDASKLRAPGGRDSGLAEDGRPAPDVPQPIEAGHSDIDYLAPEISLAQDAPANDTAFGPDGGVDLAAAPTQDAAGSDTASGPDGGVDLASSDDAGDFADGPPDIANDVGGQGGTPEVPWETGGIGDLLDASAGSGGATGAGGGSGTGGGNGGGASGASGGTAGSDAGARSASWTRIAGNSPLHVYPAVAYDPVSQRAVLFGGHTTCNESAATNQTWEWDGTSWTKVAPTGQIPSARGSIAMAFDRAHSEAIIHGGWAPPGTQLPGTFAYNLSTHSWASRGTNLASLEWYALGYDTDANQVRMFGGSDGFNFSRDVRSWVATSQSWQGLTPTGPSARARHGWTFDQEHHRFVMFGGVISWGSSNLADTWEYDPAATTWQQTATTGARPQGCDMPPPLVYDPNRKLVVMYCSQNGGETWEYDAGQHLWSQAVGGSQVGATTGASMFYDEKRQAVLLAGGCNAGSPQDGTWQFAPSQ